MAKLEVDFRKIVETLDVLVSLARGDGELIYVNPACASHYGLSPAELVGANLLDFVAEGERSQVAQHLQDASKSEQVCISRNQIARPDGRQRWIEWSHRAIMTTLCPEPVIHSVGRDIDSRVLAEARLQQLEFRYRFMIDNITDMIVVLSAEGKRLYASPSSKRILGYTPAEYLRRSPQDDCHPDDMAKVAASFAMAREMKDFTYRFRHKDGRTIWLEASGGLIEVAGQPTDRVLAVRDITQRKQDEFRMQSIRDGIDRGYIVVEFALDGRVIAANDKFCEAFGYTREEALQMRYADFHPAEEIAHHEDDDVLSLALQQGKLRRDGSKRVGKNGKIIWLNASFFPIADPDGRPAHVMKIATDVTASIEMRDRFRDADARSQAVFNAVADGIVIIDGDGIVETLNASACAMFGYAAGEVVGQNVHMLMPPPYAEGHDKLIRSYAPTGGAKRLGRGRELTGLRKSGSQFPIEIEVNEINLGGRRMFTGVVRDITERIQAETAKSQFIATVSHELRTPLTSIKGSLGLLRGGAVGKLPASASGMLEIASNNCDRLVRLINDILDADKMSIDKMSFSMETVDLCSLLRSSIEANTGYAEGRNHIRFALKAEVEVAFVQGDADRLMQVMANLMSNAVKYSPPEGVVEVAVSRVGGVFRVSVSDHGPGIDPTFLPKIFGKFEQADSTDSRRREGTGLGLNIARTIVEKHGGTIGFETQLGRGTTFYFDLGAKDPVAEAPAMAMPSRRRVLVCEDEPDIALILKTALEADAFEVEIVATAQHAKAAIVTGTFDAMTLDIGLSGEDGIWLLGELRQKYSAAALPIVVVSGRTRSRALEPGNGVAEPNAWLNKPLDAQAVVDCVRAAVSGEMGPAAQILHVEDDPDIVAIVAAILGDAVSIVSASSLAEARRCLALGKFELALLDLHLPDGNGEALLPLATREGDPMPVIVFSEIEATPAARQNAAVVLPKYQTDGDTIRATVSSLLARPLKSAIGG